MLTETDLRQLKALGIDQTQFYRQIDLFLRGGCNLRLRRPCTVGDGVRQILPEEREKYLQFHSEAAAAGRFIKFVPASGAATRMFRSLFQIQGSYDGKEEIFRKGSQGDRGAREFWRFLEKIESFAFYKDLQDSLAQDGFSLESLLKEDRLDIVLEYLLTDQGLNYGSLPKALVKFHSYDSGSRTAFEEHLDEAAECIQDANRICRLHFTVTQKDEEKFRKFAKQVTPIFAQKNQVSYEIEFSLQTRSTDTIAVDQSNKPLRDEQGCLLFRPGGHGALLTNLHNLQGDLVFIKNIDNIAPEPKRELGSYWNRLLGGYLVAAERAIHDLLGRLATEDFAGIRQEIEEYAKDKLHIDFPESYEQYSILEKKKYLCKKLNRPLRVCGVVPNVGEPGGGPFWEEKSDGTVSLQIVESAQVNLLDPQQRAIWSSSTHFNPVALVCKLRDRAGTPFNLPTYADQEAVFITRKSYNGLGIKALELPGLWNGSMADWITIFVEMPGETFCPVKTINDLLRPEHQPIRKNKIIRLADKGKRSFKAAACPGRRR